MEKGNSQAVERQRKLTLEAFESRLEAWRKTRQSKQSMPEELWEAAAELAEEYSVGEISQRFKLHSTRLKNVVLERRMNRGIKEEDFIEAGIVGNQLVKGQEVQYELEVTDGRGKVARLRVEGIGEGQLVELWREAVRSMS